MGFVGLDKARSDCNIRGSKEGTSSNHFTVGILGASFGTGNLGVAALACGTIASICHSHPDARIFLVDYAMRPAAFRVMHPGGIARIQLVNIRFSKRFYLHNNIAYLLFLSLCLRLLPSRAWRTRIQRRNPVLRAILEADIICSIAGGDSFSDIYGLGRLIYVALPQILVQLLGKPLTLLPQTLGPFRSPLAIAVARSIVRRSRMVYTRDPGGVEAARVLAGRNQAGLAFGYDMGFALQPHIHTERIPGWLVDFKGNAPLVGLNASGLLYMGGYSRSNMFGLKGDYRQLVHDLIEIIIQRHGVHVLLVPHVMGSAKDSESDVNACRTIYAEIGYRFRHRLHLLEEEYDQHEMKALIGRCDFFLGSRMHACIAAISQCIPAVGLAYSRKFHGVFESVGIEELVVDMREIGRDAVIDAVEQAYQRRAELRTKLEANIPAVRASVLGLFSRLPTDPG